MRLLKFLFRKIKSRDLLIDKDIPSSYILMVVIDKLADLIRGLCLTRSLVFVGRGCKFSHLANLKLGRGVEFGTFCQIDALSSSHGIILGRGAKVGHYTIIKVSGTLSDLGTGIVFGENVAIGDFCHIGGAGGVSIGSNTITGAYVSIHPENHNYSDLSIPIRLQGVSRQGISIGEDCWIGAKATFLDGSSIGNGCIVAAGAVVNKNFDNNVILAGVPAKVVGHRGGV
ncbi:hypothetical protein N9740_06605 [Pseudomonadales bacterium]|nr:hypothetical protein [Pseudomonadales bacterium]